MRPRDEPLFADEPQWLGDDTYPASDTFWAIATPLIAAVVVGVGVGIFAAVKGSLTP
jgi:hypothetical protein